MWARRSVLGGAGAVAGDQQVPPVRGRDLGDRRGQDLDVVGDRGAAGVAGAQHHARDSPVLSHHAVSG
jgi:hypothetical protein